MRYALGQFDLDLKDLSYPPLSKLYANEGKPEQGMVTRLLRSGWVFIYTEEKAAAISDEKHPDAKSSYKGVWHIFYYHSPEELGANGGKFVKFNWPDGTAEGEEWQVYKNDNNQEIIRNFAFVPCTVSKIPIAYSPLMWSKKLIT